MAQKILVAEDDPEARELLLLLLGGGDYELLEASDGVEALDLARSERPDLLITDIVMPRMDGYELVRRLRQDERTSDTPVIFCSASYHQREVREMARSLGVHSTLAKPFDVNSVRTIVDAALTARAAVQPEAPTKQKLPLTSAQERLSALISFSRRLFGQVEPDTIIESTCHAARDILLAQCAQLVITDGDGPHTCTVSGLAAEELEKLLKARMYRELRMTLEAGGSALYPMSPEEGADNGPIGLPGEFASMLGVPVASGTHTYGYLCVLNRIGLPGFTDEDLAVARAIAAQVAVAYENARHYQTLRAEVARRAEMESEVRSLNQELERRVAERTRQLELANHQLALANRELEAFSYSVAHDLRAPLRSIHAHAQMLSDYKGPPDAREPLIHLEQIQRGVREMNALIDGLLALSRVSHIGMQREQVSLAGVVARLVDRFTHEVPDRTIEWRIGELPQVWCDRDLIQQVFANLLDNAVKYTRPRPKAIIEVGTGTADGERYIFVRDNGVGFDMGYARKLFGVFQRLHRQDEFEGTGVGLATVSRIIERHGGRIWAESAVGKGTEFRFTLAGLGD